MTYKTLTLDYAADIAMLTLDRPERRNALNAQMITEFMSALDEVKANSARILILSGAGDAFCSGMDIEELRALTTLSFDESVKDSRRIATLFRELYDFPKPLIAAVNGPAIAGGAGLATIADFTLVTPELKLGYPEVRIGFIPAIVAVFLTRQIGEKHARDLLLTGRVIGAEEALRMGMVAEIVPRPKLLARARELAAELLSSGPMSLVFIKRLLREISGPALDRELEMAVQESARIRATKDFREGVTAFLEKRKPNWRGL